MIDVLHYNFRVEISDDTDSIEVKAKVETLIKSNIDTVVLDLVNSDGKKGMSVQNVLCDNKKCDFKHLDNKLEIYGKKYQKNDTVRLEIDYSGIPKDGLIISKNRHRKRTIFGDNWPNRAHNWLVSIDHPSDKATVDFIIISPQHYKVVANGKWIKSEKRNKGRILNHFSTMNVPIPTKVMVIGLADFAVKQYGLVDSIPVYSMVFEQESVAGLDDYSSSVEALKYYSELVGEYSYFKLANVQSKTRYGGMENAGNIFYYEASITGKNTIEPLVAHEVAHQWFGNSATEANWYNVWLSEGFATYLTNMYLENKYGKERLKSRMSNERKKVLRYNQHNSKPIIDTTVTDWNKLLNPNSYEKASWFLHMLRNKIGNDNFEKTLKTYYTKYRDSNASTYDFRRVVEDVSNQKLKDFFNQWLRKPGYPDLEINWKINNQYIYLKVEQLKWHFDFNLPVRIIFGKNDYKDFDIHINSKNDIYAIPVLQSSNSDKIELIIDPEVQLLHSAKVSKSNFEVKEVPIIGDNSMLKPGDLLFQDLDCGSLCEAIESVTKGINDAHFSHVGIVLSNEDNNTIIIEAIGNKVQTTKLKDFLSRSQDKYGRPKVVVGRVKDNEVAVRALKNLIKYKGKKYDNEFDIDDDSYYCSELVYVGFTDSNEKNIFNLSPMTFKDEKSKEFFPSWVKYYKELNAPIPEGKPGINPGGISRSDKLKILYKFGNPEGW